MSMSKLLERTNLTEAQSAFWLGYRLQHGVPLDTHHTTFIFDINGPLIVPRFRAAIRRTIDSSDALRSVIVDIRGIPQRRTVAELRYELPVISFAERADPRQACREWVELRHRADKDWSEHLFDCALIELSKQAYVWYLQIHHAAADARAFWRIVRRVERFYEEGAESGPASDATRSEGEFARYADFERRFRASSRYARSRAYWEQKLGAAAPEPRITDSMLLEQALKTHRLTRRLDPETSRQLLQLTMDRALISPAVPFMTALFAFLGKCMVGVTFDGRPDGFQDTIGVFTRTCPVLVDVAPDESFLSLAKKVALETIRVGRHQHYPVHNPVSGRLWNILFNYLAVEFGDFAGIPMTADLLLFGYSNYPLALHLRHFDAREQLTVDFDFHASVFAPDETEAIVRDYMQLLALLIADPEQPIPATAGGGHKGILLRVGGNPPQKPAATAQDASAATVEPPRSGAERILAGIWANLLKLDPVPRNESFYNLGGDSIMTLIMVFEAQKAGLNLDPALISGDQTVAQLALAADAAHSASGGGAAARTGRDYRGGAVQLLPVQHRFFATTPVDPHHWNLAYMFEPGEAVDLASLHRAMHALAAHHTALRCSFRFYGQSWQQIADDWIDMISVTQEEVGDLTEPERSLAIEHRCAELQASLDLGSGPLVRLAVFPPGRDGKARVLLCAHHLIIDPISVAILTDDLRSAYRQAACGEPIQLPPATTELRDWAEALAVYAAGREAVGEVEYWSNVASEARRAIAAAPLPRDETAGRNTSESLQELLVSLSDAETRELLRDIPHAYHTEINDVLLMALAHAIGRWARADRVCLALEGHGREHIIPGINLSRTVGWLVSAYPAVLRAPRACQITELMAVHDQLKAVPHKGVGYGVLRYLSQDRNLSARLMLETEPEIMFTYLGQTEQWADNELFRLIDHPVGPLRSPRRLRRHLLNVVARVRHGRLEVAWHFSRNIHQLATIENVAADFIAALRTVLDAGRSDLEVRRASAGSRNPQVYLEARLG